MSRVVTIVTLILCGTIGACDRKNKDSIVKEDTYIKFTSHLGNSFVAPSQWTVEDKGDTFSLQSPDGHAIIHAIMFTAEGSGSIDKFRETMTSGMLPKGATRWEPSQWVDIQIGDDTAGKRDLVPAPASDQQWRLYVHN